MDAVSSNSVDLVDYLLKNSIGQVNGRSDIGATCCHIAADEGNSKMLDRLLQAKADPNCVDDAGRTPMHHAASSGRHEMIKLLHSNGVSVNAAVGQPTEPLGVACENGFIKCVDALIQLGADVNKPSAWFGTTPLHLAAIGRRPKVIERLLAHSTSLSARDKYAKTPLDYAIKHPSSLQAIGHEVILKHYFPLDLEKRRAVIWTTIWRELQSPTLYATTFTVPEEMGRLMALTVLRDSYFNLKDAAYSDIIRYLHMELAFIAEPGKLRLTLACDMCQQQPQLSENHDAWLCYECQYTLCPVCHESYEKGWKTPHSPPESLKQLERLEEDIRPFKEVMLPIIEEIRVEIIVITCDFFTMVKDWVSKKQKEYEEWDSEFNSSGRWNNRKRPGQELLQLLDEGRKLSKKLEEKGVSSDMEKDEWSTLDKKYATYHRVHDNEKDNDKFVCSGHQYLHISRKQYDKLRKETKVFQPNGRLSPEWFR